MLYYIHSVYIRNVQWAQLAIGPVMKNTSENVEFS